MKVIIVGGVAGGATAAARIRRLNEHAEITVFERSGYISYANCGLPYYIGDVITDPEELTLQTPESFFKHSSAGVVSCLCNGRSLPMKLLFPAHETGVPCQWNSCANKT